MVVAVLFFRKRRVAVPAVIGLMVASVLANLGQALLNASMFGELNSDIIKPVVHSCVFGAIWIPYFLRSRRVRGTFVR